MGHQHMGLKYPSGLLLKAVPKRCCTKLLLMYKETDLTANGASFMVDNEC